MGRAVRKRLPRGRAKVVGVDETWLKVKGSSGAVGVVEDVGGRTLSIELSGSEFDYRTTRGLKSDWGALNFMAVVCDVLA